MSKSANTNMNTNFTLMYPAETLSEEEGAPQEAAYTKQSLTVKTEVPVATDAVTAGPTTVGNVADEEWAIPMKKEVARAGFIPIAQGGGDDWGTAGLVKQKKKKSKG